MKIKALSLLTLLAFAAAIQADEQYSYTILVDNGVKAGEQIVKISDNGEVSVRYIFKDNGRGPELDEKISLNKEGFIKDYQAKGNTTFGSVINESFKVEGNNASWSTGQQHHQAPYSSNALYLPVDGSPYLASVAIAAMAKSGKNSLPLLPSGTLTQHLVSELMVDNGGEKQQVQLLVQTGIGFEPNFVWATKSDNPRLFAYLAPGYLTLIEEGWQHNAKAMLEMQQKAEIVLLEKLAGLPKKLTGLTVVRNARIFDSQSLKLSASSDIYLLRGKITSIVPAGTLQSPVAHEIDAANRIVLPGLFDMHGHLSRWEGPLHLAAGVTTLRDMGNDNATLQQMMDEISADKLLAPTIVPTGFLEGESAYSARNGFVIKDLAEAKNAIDWYAAHGYPQLKIYNSFPKEILKETVTYAHSRGLRVSGHVPAFLKAEDAIAAGFDEIQHINQLMLNFLVKPDTDTRTLDRFYLPAKQVADLDLQGKAVQDFIRLLKTNNVTVDPTLATFDFLKKTDGTVGEPWRAIVAHLPPDIQRSYARAELDIPDQATADRYGKSYAKMVEFVGLMYKAGIPVVAGTDELAGFTLQGELELLVKAGLTAAEALQVATLNGARYSKVEQHKGQIKVGFDADLLLVDGDPTQNIADIRKLALVITQGKAMVPTDLYRKLGVEPFVKDQVKIRDFATEAGQGGGKTRQGHRHLH
ncbi:MAG: amidohydrolase family protein [Gammaproteobacteria bacterium]|nr:amidohydrolase family protein [Gammaproteobacteria bacterium]MBU2058696.1 amidohydrolase family protein [Gammaproteobacteria bacterium]MBU2175879.1 amidohydrolase family protein [Gammaproteobacteria bacterium]MBU2246211.1 amidohydrolase family protein [Gammaproteobacteria bacterium]MBU2391771.1 amidohydrolase family protein [Gammaproteobacteria bacterium]